MSRASTKSSYAWRASAICWSCSDIVGSSVGSEEVGSTAGSVVSDSVGSGGCGRPLSSSALVQPASTAARTRAPAAHAFGLILLTMQLPSLSVCSGRAAGPRSLLADPVSAALVLLQGAQLAPPTR